MEYADHLVIITKTAQNLRNVSEKLEKSDEYKQGIYRPAVIYEGEIWKMNLKGREELP